VCHQSVGLIARAIEQSGIPTLSLSSARSITAAVNPPRAVYLDYPLGHTAGKPNAPEEQLAILRHALDAFTKIKRPGEIIDLPFEWRADDAWKDKVMQPQTRSSEPSKARGKAQRDDRVARHATPQYQSEQDERAADPDCPTCIFFDVKR
jgi:D-proline reductase (dithiol) PrdB